MSSLRRILALAALLLFVGVAGTAVSTAASAEDVSCNCVAYVRSQTGLPGGPPDAAHYTESVMNSFGYHRVPPTSGAIMVWDANQKGAYGSGHMAIVTSAYYDNGSKKWQISVRDANWGGCGIRDHSFSWGDLYGVNSYVR